jgi:phosphopantetheinyl transferase
VINSRFKGCEAINCNRVIDGVHIWRAALDEAGWPEMSGLPLDERERAERIIRPQAARRWAASRWALRRVLESYLEEPAGRIELQVGEQGKPHLCDGGGIEFNLSHSNGLALVAVTEGREVGVDVELVDPRRERPAVFYAAWTRHEASLKCLGVTGATTSLRSSTSEVSDRRLARETTAVESIDVVAGYAAAVAVAAPEVGPIECRSLRAG